MEDVDVRLFISERSCNIPLLRALSKISLRGHLLASDPNYYAIGRLIMIMRHYG
jgi:hypothetical protein